MFSVVIPLFNKEKSIERTILSVLKQSFVDFEIIIVNDGSTDNSVDVVKQISDTRIRLVEKPNGGVSSARNRGIEEARNEWVCFLDGDDQWHSDYLSTMYGLIQKYSTGLIKIVATGFAKANSSLDILDEIKLKEERVITDYFHEVLVNRNTVVHTSAIVVNKVLFDQVGYFNERLTHGEDLDMWERLSRVSNIAMLPEVKSYYIQDSENRAVKKFPPLNRTRIYNINAKVIITESERKYYKHAIVFGVLKSLRAKRFVRAGKLFIKHALFVRPLDYFKIIFFNKD